MKVQRKRGRPPGGKGFGGRPRKSDRCTCGRYTADYAYKRGHKCPDTKELQYEPISE